MKITTSTRHQGINHLNKRNNRSLCNNSIVYLLCTEEETTTTVSVCVAMEVAMDTLPGSGSCTTTGTGVGGGDGSLGLSFTVCGQHHYTFYKSNTQPIIYLNMYSLIADFENRRMRKIDFQVN